MKINSVKSKNSFPNKARQGKVLFLLSITALKNTQW